MGENGSAICVVCGERFKAIDMEPIFTGRVKYRCLKCRADEDKQAKARADASFMRGYAKRGRNGN